MSRYDYSDIGCLGWCFILLLVVALIWFEVWLACWLWGILMVSIFGLPALTMWQTFGLMILAGLMLPSPGVRVNK